MKRSPLHDYHQKHGAKFVEFAGWEMPISYGSVIAEHQATRTQAGFFDVSHMGRLKITGRHGRRLLERVLTRRVTDMAERTCRYSLICNEAGGILDDVIVYRFDNHWMLVVNASNRAKIMSHLQAQLGDFSADVEDQTESTVMVALQGPTAMGHIGRFSSEVPTLAKYAFTVKNLLIMKLTVSRTGYTGEDGVEVILPAGMADKALKLLLKESDGKPPMMLCGLAARDTLRMEAGMPLYGHELSEDIDPISAGLKFAVDLDKDAEDRVGPFIGIEALKAIAAAGPKRRRVGLIMEGKRSPRQGMKVMSGATEVGEVTSGCLSPTLGYPIAMAYVDADARKESLHLKISDDTVNVNVVKLPFYKTAGA